MSRDQAAVIKLFSPSAIARNDLEDFKRFVLEGGEVNPETLTGLVSRALFLACARLNDQLIGVGAIKRPNPSYRTDTFTKAGVQREAANYEFELGWIYVHPAARRQGVASALVGTLDHSLNGTSIYATSRVNNDGIHTILSRFGFHPLGASYPSQLNDPMIQLFVRDSLTRY